MDKNKPIEYQKPQYEQPDISRQEAENIAYRFIEGNLKGGLGTQVESGEIQIVNSYREDSYWKVSMIIFGEGMLVEINSKTGKVEYLGGEGKRLPAEELVRQGGFK